ncbi:hypothetical protein D3C78_1318690 [compost metagenome]
MANSGQERGHRHAVILRHGVDKADIQRVLAVKMLNHADFAFVQLHHYRQPPAVDGLLRGGQQLKGQSRFTRQLCERGHHRFASQPRRARDKRAGGAGHTITAGDVAERLRPVLQRLLGETFTLRNIGWLHGWISTV